MNFAAGSQLAQARPSGTSAVNAFTATLITEITKIVVSNTTASAAAYSIYHDDDGSTFDQTTSLFYEISLAANSTVVIDSTVGAGFHMSPSGQIGIKTGTGSALTFTIYGVTQHTGEKL